ncbi:hypothetical protein S40285_08561 [Stachybotrys chlorohalonatus IBT 40285]|uniref:endo-1,4-beta-xylanase n=1 Tax=Stachybotrys chlorohalonatus (strain IBT 40285) TaxID=1283841 RepID=A0A084QZK0_STAC4|nr:hypothetical protein S40285_08561 [Stachybotrys chlorohalonata IBT 40285]
MRALIFLAFVFAVSADYFTLHNIDTPDVVNFTSPANSPSFNVTWIYPGTFEVGKGWNPGTSRVINYTGTYAPSGNSLIGVMGWTRYVNSPLMFYKAKSPSKDNPGVAGQQLGRFTSDDGTYGIFREYRVNQPSIDGPMTHLRYWSVRFSRRTRGTITTKNHFDAWASVGLVLGSHDYQVLTVEGYYSSGRAGFTFSG